MQSSPRRKGLVFFLVVCFLCAIGTQVISGHIALALVFTGLGLFFAALHGTAESSKARRPLMVLSVLLNVAAIGLMVTGNVV